MKDLKEAARTKLLEKSQDLGMELMKDWETFRTKEIYRFMTPDGYIKGNDNVIPKEKYYKVGKKYIAWSTSPGLSFDYLGEVVCIKSGWREQHEYGGDAGPIVGYHPWGIFKTIDNREIAQFGYFISTIEIKNAVDEALEEII